MGKALPNSNIFLLLILLSLIILGLDKIGFLSLPKQYTSYISNPISFGLYRTSQQIVKQFQFVFLVRYTAQENKALKSQMAQILSENANLKRQLLEKEALISQSQHLDPRTYNLLPARPIGLTRFLKIDKGTGQGIKVGEAVVYQDNYIGKIIEVSPNSANVQLLADPQSKVAAFSLGKEGRAKGVLVGQFGNDYLFDKILHEEQIKIEDLVYSEGTEGFLPRGLILGKVVEVQERPNEVFKQAKVQPVFDIRDLELVFVIEE